MVELATEDSERRVSDSSEATAPREQRLVGLISPYARSERGRLLLMSLAAILGGFAEAGALVVIARVAVALPTGKNTVELSLGPLGSVTASLWALIVFAGVLVGLRMLLQWVQAVLALHATASIVNRTRKELIRQYLASSWALQSLQREGRLQELLTTYADASSRAVQALTQAAIATFNLSALLITALAVNAVASISAAIAALAIGLLLRPLRAAVQRRSRRQAAAGLEFATGVTELAATLQEVRVFGVERQVGARLDGFTDRVSKLMVRTGYMSASISVLYQGVAMFLIVGALGVAYAVDFSGLGALGAIVLIMIRSLSYAQGVQAGIQGLHEEAPYLQTLNEERRRYEVAAAPRAGAPVVHIRSVSFDEVTFSYEPDHSVLRDISFSVKHGEIVGIVGPSGAGKSTLVQLLLRLRDPDQGVIMADGRDVRGLDLDEWYDHVTFVSQDTRMFAGTVADNIRFFRDADPAKVEQAAKLAHLHDDIASWPLGYDTPVGERGSQLSGGQRQRLCIARALLDQPDVVVFDEPTSALDVKSEALIRETISNLAPERTVFVIAHRLSTLSICDRIMVILGGELQGFDTSANLEASNPFYREALRLSGMR